MNTKIKTQSDRYTETNPRGAGRPRTTRQPVETHIQKRLAEIMGEREITQLELGKALGHGLQTGHSVFHMNSRMTVLRLKQIADWLRVGVESFFQKEVWHPELDAEMATVYRELDDDQKKIVYSVAKTFADKNRADGKFEWSPELAALRENKT